jgi:hypothetical protein
MLDRYPNLKFAFLEGGISWVPAHVERMDDHFDNPRYGARDLISHPPSDYLKSGRIFFGCEGNESFLGRVVEEVGEDLFMFSSDYPHADRTEGTAQPSSAATISPHPCGKTPGRTTRGAFILCKQRWSNRSRIPYRRRLRSARSLEAILIYPIPIL